MQYTLYRIDDKSKTIYIKISDNENKDNFESDYQRIMKYASDNNYIVNYIYENTDNYEDTFSYKKSL